MVEEKVKCPKCGSEQITVTNRGYNSDWGILCCILTGGLGLLFGLIGSGEPVRVCTNCKTRF